MSTALAAAFRRHVAGDLAGALAYYTAGLRAAPPERPQAWFSVAALLADREQYGAALACARKAAGLAPEDPDALKNLGCILYRMQRYPEARVWLEAAHARRPGDHEIMFNLGATAYCLGDLASSEDWYIQSAGAAVDDERLRSRALT